MLKLRTRLDWLRSAHAPEYLAAKATYLGEFSVLATLVTALFVASTWVWDTAIDPSATNRVFWLRVLETLGVLALAPLMRANPVGSATRLGLFIVPAFVQVTFIEVLSRLDGGLTYGMGGFIYFFIFVPFMAQAQSLRFNALLLAYIAALPNALVVVRLTEPLNLSVYNAYVWMAYGPVVLMLALVEYLIYQVHKQHHQLKHHADTDGLTGLTNRRTFLERGEGLMANARTLGRPVSILFADVDHFKSLNDRYGHAAGDGVLVEVARRMGACVRSTDLIARFGGEEFVIILPDLDGARAAQVGEAVCRHIASDPIEVTANQQPQGVYVTLSVGSATAEPNELTTLHELIRRADNAAYHAKATGRNSAAAYEASAGTLEETSPPV